MSRPDIYGARSDGNAAEDRRPRCEGGCDALVSEDGEWCLACWPERDEDEAGDEALNSRREREV